MAYVDQVFFLILDLLMAGYSLVTPVVMVVFSTMLGCALLRLIVNWLAGSMGNMFGDIIVLFVMFWIFVTFAWSAHSVVEGAGAFALTLGSSIIGHEPMTPKDFGPSALWDIGSHQADQILATKNALCTSAWECTKTLGEQIMLEFAALCIYGAFAFLLFEMAMTIIGYKVHGLFMLLFLPMAILPFTKSFTEGAIQGWVNNLVKMTIIAMVAGLASRAFGLMDLPPKPVFDDIIPAVLLSGFVAFLAWQAKTLASGIISAVPQLSGQAIARGAGNVMRAVATGAGAATSAALVGNREKQTIGQAASNLAAGAQRAPQRIANAAAAVQSGGAATKSYWQNVRAANTSHSAAGGRQSQQAVAASRPAATLQPASANGYNRPAQATVNRAASQAVPQQPAQKLQSTQVQANNTGSVHPPRIALDASDVPTSGGSHNGESVPPRKALDASDGLPPRGQETGGTRPATNDTAGQRRAIEAAPSPEQSSQPSVTQEKTQTASPAAPSPPIEAQKEVSMPNATAKTSPKVPETTAPVMANGSARTGAWGAAGPGETRPRHSWVHDTNNGQYSRQSPAARALMSEFASHETMAQINSSHHWSDRSGSGDNRVPAFQPSSSSSAMPTPPSNPTQTSATSATAAGSSRTHTKYRIGEANERAAEKVTDRYHGLSNGAKPDANSNAPYETDWKERNPREAAEVAERLARLKAGTWK